MNRQLLASTAVCLIVGTAAFAQSPSNSTTNSPTAAQPQTSTPSSGSASTTPQPSTSTQSTTTSTGAPATGSTAQTQPSNSTTSQSTAPAASSTTSQSAPATNSATSQSAPAASTSPSQAQTNPPPATQSGGSQTPSQAQSNNPPPAANQAQQTPNGGNANSNAAQQPARSNQPATAQSSSTNVNAQVNINDQQRTRLSQSFARVNVQPLSNVNFSVSVGVAIPRDVRLHPLPADVVEVVPQYRGYNFVMVRDEIVIVDPATYKIVTVLPRSGGATAAAPARTNSKVTFTDRDRDVVRKHARTSTERRTTGSSGSTRVEIRRGERLPDTVEIEEFPETVYREAPALREYRYIHRENRTYLVDPGERRVIEEID
jgi:hypothetical protein